MQTCLITGGSRGIGKEIALKLASEKRHIIITGRHAEALESVCSMVKEKGGECEFILADFAAISGMEFLLQRLKSITVDVLVNNAAVANVEPLEDLSLEKWGETLAVNVTAPYLLTRKLVRKMKSGSSIVNILSIASKQGYPNWSAYCMSKFAMEGFSQSVREELRPKGIRVINVYPAATDTDIWNEIQGEWSRDKMMDPLQVAEAVEYALSAPPSVLIENITLGGLAGNL